MARSGPPIWIEWRTEHTLKLFDVMWVRRTMDNLLDLQHQGRMSLAEEGYLMTPMVDRLITMSAWVGMRSPPGGVIGMKWVGSRTRNPPKWSRGEAVTVLNCGITGLPLIAYLGTDISLLRTAAFADAAVRHLVGAIGSRKVGLIGAGRLNSWQMLFLQAHTGGSGAMLERPDVYLYDIHYGRAAVMAAREGCHAVSEVDPILECDIVFCATAGANEGWMDRIQEFQGSLWVSNSLRDIQAQDLSFFRTIVVDSPRLAESQNTPYHRAVQLGLVRPGKALCQVEDAMPLAYPILVNPMGMAAWDVGFGYEVFQAEYRAAQQQLLGKDFHDGEQREEVAAE